MSTAESPGNNGGGGRVRSLSAAASGAVRAGTVIGSVGRAVEELVRNAASASAATVTVVVGSGGDGAGSGSGSSSSSSSSSQLSSHSSSIITVHDDGRGIDPRSLQKYVGTDHCSSWGAASSSSSSSSRAGLGAGAGLGGRGNWQAAASVGLFAERGESLRSIAALAVEMRIASSSSVGLGEEEETNGGAVSGTSAAFAGEENRRHSLPAMAEGEKKRRTAAAHHHHHQAHSQQQQQQQQQQVVVRCEKVIREGRAVSFSSSSSSATGTGRTWDDAGTSVHASSGGGDADGSSILPPALLVGAATTSGIRDVTAVGGKRSRSSFGGTSSKGAYLYNHSLQQQQQQQQQQTTGTAITVVGLFHRYAVRRRHQERTTGVGGGNGGVNGGANRSSSRTATAAAASADLSQARNCLRSMALAYPLLAFRLIDGRTGTVDSSWDGVAAAAPARNGDARSTSRPRFDPSLPLTANFSAQRDTYTNSSSSSHLSSFQNDDGADDNTAGHLVDSLSRRFRQHCGEAALRNHRLVGMVYDEEVESTSSHSNMSCNSNGSSVALPRRRRSARLPWSVVGVLCIGTATDDNSNNNNPLDDDNTRTEQLQQQQKKKADRAIIKSRQHELVFINKRPARYNNVLAAIVQDEISTFLPLQEDGQPPSSSSFVVHATVAPRDVDLIIDENRSSLAVPQRERMERLLRRAVASTMKNNGYTRRRASQQSDRGLSSRRRRGHHPQQQSQMRNSSRHHHSRGGRSAFDPSSVLGSISTNSDSTAFASVGSIASSKVISGEAVFKSSSSALPSSPYFSTSSSRSGGDSSSNADVDTDKPSSASPFTDAFFGSQPMTDLERKSPAVCFEEAFLSTGPTNNGVTIEGSEPSDNDENDPPAEEDHSLDVTNTSWTRTRLRALENQISSLVVDPGQGSRGAAPSMTLSKEMLSKAEVIAQLDEKYVIIKAGGLLCVVDQHAADERVSLERLERRLLTEIQDGAGAHTEGGNNRGAPLMRSVSLLPAQAISLSPSQLAVVQHNTDLLEQWRFSVELPSNPHEPLLLKGVPGIGDKVAKKGDFLQYLQALESRSSDAALVTPAFIKRTIASNACRYSIMFGDHLSSEQMENLIGSLSKCDLPFICAHGRPSVIPLLSLKGLDDE